MKKWIILCLLFILVGSMINLYAADDVNMFAKTVQIVKIYSHELGYKVTYYKTAGGVNSIYIPFSWFNQKAGKGQVLWGSHRSFPYFTVFWVDGKLNHIKLFLQENMGHLTWGTLNKTKAEVQELFNVDPENFEFDF